MTKYFIKSTFFLTLILGSHFLLAQVVAEKETYGSLAEGLRAQVQLAGERGPQNINWIDEGERFSYIDEVQGVGRSFDHMIHLMAKMN